MDSSEQGKPWTPSCYTFKAYISPSLKGQVQFGRIRHAHPLIVDSCIVVKLTRGIIQTFQKCDASFSYSKALNPKRYLTNPSTPASNGGLDNVNSDLILFVNDVIVNEGANHRYIIKDLLGQGTFGQVAKCWADESKSFVAVKVIKNHPAYRKQAIVEISTLNMLNGKYDPDDNHHIVRMLEYFLYKEHLCIVFEMLGLNLFELLKVNNFKGISLNLIRNFSKQILLALSVLRDASIIHCDLKPENILLTTRPASAELKVIDFGAACSESRKPYSYIQSRFYRSPEVVLGHTYTTAIDMWSFGCVAAELFLGWPLFPAQSQYDLLQRMIRIIGDRPPDHILRQAKNSSKYFKHVGAPSRHGVGAEGQRYAYQFLTLEDYELRENVRPALGGHYFAEDSDLEQIIMNYNSKKMSSEELKGECKKRLAFMDFIRGLLNFDPSKRWTPWQAAQHPFMTQQPFTGPFQPPAEPLRLPIHQGLTVDHNPAAGHWLGTGLSPQVNPNVFQFGSPRYHSYPFSYGSSYGSTGSYGSFDNGGVGLGNSFGIYCDPSGAYTNHQLPLSIINPAFGFSPDAWPQRTAQFTTNQGLTQGCLRMSPSNSFTSMSLGASPSKLTPPSSHFHNSPGSPSMGSPSRYGPSLLARSSGAAAATALGKTAALGKFQKHGGWGSPGSNRSGSIDSSHVTCNNVQQNIYTEITSSSYIEGTSLSYSHCSFPLHGSQFPERNAIISGPSSEQTQALKTLTYPTGSLGALMSKTQPSSTGGEDASPAPNPGDWDPNYSEDLLLETDGGERSAPMFCGSEGAVPDGIQGLGPFNMEDLSGGANIFMQDGLKHPVLRPGGIFPMYGEGGPRLMHGYGWTFRPLQQISPSRLGQQPMQLLPHQYQHVSYNLHLNEQL